MSVSDALQNGILFGMAMLRIRHKAHGWVDELKPFVVSLGSFFNAIVMTSLPSERHWKRASRQWVCGDGFSGHCRSHPASCSPTAAAHPDDVKAAADAAVLIGGNRDSIGLLPVAWSRQRFQSARTSRASDCGGILRG